MQNNNSNYSKIAAHIDYNPIMVVSTINDDDTPYGAAVYACADDFKPVVYFLTKNGTKKYRNLKARPKVALTSVNEAENSTIQISGTAFVESDARAIDRISKRITRAHAIAQEWLPPISKLHAGEYELVGVRVHFARLAEYKGAHIGDEKIFTQID